jgi:hypothetical protein
LLRNFELPIIEDLDGIPDWIGAQTPARAHLILDRSLALTF